MISIACIVLAFCLTSIGSICTDSFQRTQGQVTLATQPKCGALTSDTFVNFNSGINLDKIKTIYSFGDSWSATGNSKGGPPKPPIVKRPKPTAGGRATNGLMWTEGLAAKKKLMSYAIGGATVDSTLWSSRSTKTDMVNHVKTFLQQGLKINPESDLATIFYGINDYAASNVGPGTMEEAATRLLRQIELLIGAGLKKFVVLSPPFSRKQLDSFDTTVWRGLKRLQKSKNIQFAYVDISALFTAITHDPHAFGYKSTNSCCKSLFSTEGACTDPNHTLYYMPSHPSKETHRLIAEWVQKVLKNCVTSGSSAAPVGGPIAPPLGKSSGVAARPGRAHRS